MGMGNRLLLGRLRIAIELLSLGLRIVMKGCVAMLSTAVSSSDYGEYVYRLCNLSMIICNTRATSGRSYKMVRTDVRAI